MHRRLRAPNGPTPIGRIVPRVMADLRPSSATSTTPPKRGARYLAATRFALKHIAPIYRAANIPLTDVGIATIVGQLLALPTATRGHANGNPTV